MAPLAEAALGFASSRMSWDVNATNELVMCKGLDDKLRNMADPEAKRRVCTTELTHLTSMFNVGNAIQCKYDENWGRACSSGSATRMSTTTLVWAEVD